MLSSAGITDHADEPRVVRDKLASSPRTPRLLAGPPSTGCVLYHGGVDPVEGHVEGSEVVHLLRGPSSATDAIHGPTVSKRIRPTAHGEPRYPFAVSKSMAVKSNIPEPNDHETEWATRAGYPAHTRLLRTGGTPADLPIDLR